MEMGFELEVEIFPGVFLNGLGGLYISKRKCLVIADLHLGLEQALAVKGIRFPFFQLKHIKRRVELLLETYRPEVFIVNGDLKHDFGRINFQEVKEVSEFLNFSCPSVREFVLVRGNHDNFLWRSMFPENMVFTDRYSLGNFTFVHGHKKEKPSSEYIVLGHEHPSVKFSDEFGGSVKMPCFLVGEVSSSRIIVLPAFSPLSSGTNVSMTSKENFLSPLLREFGVEDFKVYGVDGDCVYYLNLVRYLKRSPMLI